MSIKSPSLHCSCLHRSLEDGHHHPQSREWRLMMVDDRGQQNLDRDFCLLSKVNTLSPLLLPLVKADLAGYLGQLPIHLVNVSYCDKFANIIKWPFQPIPPYATLILLYLLTKVTAMSQRNEANGGNQSQHFCLPSMRYHVLLAYIAGESGWCNKTKKNTL